MFYVNPDEHRILEFTVREKKPYSEDGRYVWCNRQFAYPMSRCRPDRESAERLRDHEIDRAMDNARSHIKEWHKKIRELKALKTTLAQQKQGAESCSA